VIEVICIARSVVVQEVNMSKVWPNNSRSLAEPSQKELFRGSEGKTMTSRRDVIKAGAMAAIAGALPSSATFADPTPEQHKPAARSFWPDGARMVISVSMQMEAGAEPTSGAESPMPKIDPKYPDLPASKWYEYGFKEGLPRLLDIFDRRKIKVTSHMVGAAVDLHPALAKEIVQRGHEASGHGQTWMAQLSMSPEEERASYQQSIESIERVTGTRPIGFNAFWLRGTPHTLEILHSLGFIYHIDDVSRDEPFLINVRDKPFAVVPYTLHMNDIVDYETRYFSTAMYSDDLKAEFDALYAEAGTRRRMMSVSAHDRIAGRPSRANVLEQFITYAQSHPGVAFMRKDEIARFALESPGTLREGI
jgi:peptidoglycan/xylan/chitin deacetylase (PgdA/CDA1 family)